MMQRDRLAIALSLFMFLAVAPVHAQGVDYAAALKQGSELYEKGDKLGAIRIWERLLESLGEERGWKVLYNLGLAYESVGDPTRAVLRLDAFVKRSLAAGGGPELEERRQDATERLKAIRATHAALNVKPPASGTVVLVRVGSAEPRPAGFVVYLAPGDHEIELYAGTANAKRSTVHATAGAISELMVPELPPREKKDAAPPRVEEERFPTGWLIGGAAVTIASGALPLFLGLRASSKRDDAEAINPASARYAGAREDFEGARSAYQLSFIVPAVLAAATAVIVIIKLPSKSAAAGRSSPWSGLVTF
jgi:hypothetical protein